MNAKRVVIATVILWVVSTAIIWLMCGWLFSWVYEIPPNIWLSPEAMMTTKNIILSNIVNIIGALLFVLVFSVLRKGIPGTGAKKGLLYGFLIWLVASLAGMATMPFYMTIAKTVIVYWIAQQLVINLIKGAIVGAICKK